MVDTTVRIGDRLLIRRHPEAETLTAYIIDIVVTLSDIHGVGVNFLIEIAEDGPRPNKQLYVGMFLLVLWVEWAK